MPIQNFFGRSWLILPPFNIFFRSFPLQIDGIHPILLTDINSLHICSLHLSLFWIFLRYILMSFLSILLIRQRSTICLCVSSLELLHVTSFFTSALLSFNIRIKTHIIEFSARSMSYI